MVYIKYCKCHKRCFAAFVTVVCNLVGTHERAWKLYYDKSNVLYAPSKNHKPIVYELTSKRNPST